MFKLAIKSIFSIAACAVAFPFFLSAQTSWKGTTSTSWGTASNWTNGVPTSTTDAIIGDANFTGPNQPALSSNSTCKNLTIGTGSVPSTLTVGNRTLTVSGSVTIGANGTVNHTSVKSITVKGNWDNSGTYSGATNSTVVFSGVAQVISGSATTTFSKLTISAGSVVTLGTNITTTNTLTLSGSLDPGDSPTYKITNSGGMTVKNGGTLFVRASTLAGNYTVNPTFNAGSTARYDASSTNQTVSGLSYSNLVISNPGTSTLGGNATIGGNLTIEEGTFDLATFTANRSSLGGTFSLPNGTILKIGGTNTFPSNYSANTLGVTSTVEYSGTNQTVSAKSYGNLILSSASGAATKTMPGTAMTVAGDFSSSIGSGTSVSCTAGAAITVNGNVTIGSSTTFNGGSFSHTVAGSITNSGTLTGSTSTIILNGNGTSLTGSGAYNFNNLTVSGSGVTADAATNITVAGALATIASGTFTHTAGGGGTLTLSGAGGSMSGSEISLDNLTVSGSVMTSSTFALAGNLSVSGSLTASGGTLTMTGSSKTISGGGTITFSSLNVDGSVSTSANVTVNGDLSVNGSLTATLGTTTFGGTSTLSGTVDLFNVTLNGTSLQLGSGAVLGVAGALAVTSGTLDVTTTIPNTVGYNGSGAQTVVALTYHNLTLSNGGTKSAGGALSINGDLTIGAGTTLSAGSSTHSLRGDWINNGTFTAGTSTVQLLGGLDVAVNGATTFNTLTVNKDLSTDIVTLANSVTAATVNMTTGRLHTGTNSITITSNRSGNGIIVGTIIRTHSFSTGVSYAFEGPFNTLTFSSVSGVSSVSVTVRLGPVADFSFGGSVNREYTIAVTGGSYSATLRLHYEDAELNGNTEAGLELWQNSGSWVNSGKTSNDAVNNWVEQGGLTAVDGRWTLSEFAKVVRWNGSVSSAWEDASNWTVVQGSPSTPPAATDVVELGDSLFTNQPTISSAVSMRGVEFGSAKAVTLTLASGSLTTSGNVSGTWASAAAHTITVGAQSLSIGGTLSLSDDTGGHVIHLNVGTGSVSIAGTLRESGGANITVTGTGTLNISGDFIAASGTFTAGSGTVTYNGSGSQSVAGIVYNQLAVNKSSGTATLSSAATVGGNLTLSTGGTFITNAALTVTGSVTINSGTMLNGGNAVISVGGDWTNNGTFTGSTGTVTLNGSGSQTVAATTFNNLTINKSSGTATAGGNLPINGNLTLTAGTLNLSTFTANRSVSGGTLTLSAGALLRISGANNFPLNFTTKSLVTTSTVEYDGVVAQTVRDALYGNLTISNGGANEKTLNGATTVAGTMLINSGATLNGSSYPLTVQGNWSNSGTFTPATGTVSLTGNGKTVSGSTTFNNLTVSGSYTATSDITINGTTSVSGSFAGGSTTLTVSGNLTNSGTITSSGTITFTGSGAQNLSLNSGFSSTGTVNFNGTVAPAFGSSTAPVLQNVAVNNSAGISPSLGWTINGSFSVASGASFSGTTPTHSFLGSVSNSGTITSSGTLRFIPSGAATLSLLGTAFTSTGAVEFGGTGAITIAGGAPTFNNAVISNSNAVGVTPSAAWTVGNDLTVSANAAFNGGTGLLHTVSGNWTCNGTFNGGTSTVTFNSTAGAVIGGSGSSVFHHLVIASSSIITVSSDVSLDGNFTNNGTFASDGITITFTGSSGSTIGGTTSPTPIDQIDISKTSAATTLAVNLSALTNLTVSSGTLDAASFTISEDATLLGALSISANATLKIGGSNPSFTTFSLDAASTVEYSGGAQTILAAPTYGNLTISTSGTKSAGGALTIAGSFTLSTGTFSGGNNIHSIGGNWTMASGTFTNTNTTIQFNGTGSQNISSTGAFNNLTVNKSAGSLTLSTDITVNGTLTLTNGKITTDVNKVVIPSGGSVSKTNGFVIGNLQKNVATGAASRTFEIGDASGYTPVSVSFASVSVAGNLIGSTSSGDHPDIVNSGINPSKSVNRYWTLTNSGITFTTYSVTFTFLSGDVDAGASTSSFSISRKESGTWSVPTVGTRTATTTQATGVTGFGDFQIGEGGKVWDGGAGTSNWGDANNWNPNGVPSNVDNVILGTAVTVNINVAATCLDVVLDNASLVFTIQSGNSLTVSGSLTLTNGTLNTQASFPSVAGTTTVSGGTVGYTGTGAQTVSALQYTNLTLSGARTSNNITLAAGTISVSGTFTNSATFTTGVVVSTGNTFAYNGSGAQTVVPIDYNNLSLSGSRSGNSITLDSNGTIGIAGTFSASASFTSGGYITTSSSVNYNGTGAQSITAFRYHHLSVSGARGGNTITLASDSIHVAGTFTPTATSVSYVNTGNIFDLNGSTAQDVPAFTYYTLVLSGSGPKTISSSLTANNDFVTRTGTSVTVGAGATVQVDHDVSNAGAIVNNGTIIAGN